MRSELIRGNLDMLLLAVLAEAPAHGYSVVEALRRRSGDAFDLPEGTIYPALHRLESAGLLTSTWSATGGRRRRVYVVTATGHAALDAKAVEWRRFTVAIEAVLNRPVRA